MGDTFTGTLSDEDRARDLRIISDPRTKGFPGIRGKAEMELLPDSLQYQDPSSDPRYADMLAKLQGYAIGTLTPEDRAREYEALGEAQRFAKGQEGMIAQEAAARGGGGAGTSAVAQQVAAQGAASRLGSADVATAGMASQRALAAQEEFARLMQANAQMQNQFALQKAGMTMDALKYSQMLQEAQAERNQQFIGNAIKGVAGVALGAYMANGLPGGSEFAGMPSTTGQEGYFSSDNVGIPIPGRSSSTLADVPGAAASIPAVGGAMPGTGGFDTSGAMTADAAAKAYAAALPFADLAAPGSAPSTTSGGGKRPFDFNPDNFTMPSKPVMPGGY